MADENLVNPQILGAVVEEIGEADDRAILQRLAAREPVLGAYVGEKMLVVSGKLALSGAPPEIVQACYEEVLKLVAVSVGSVWRASDDLWSGVNLDRVAAAAPGCRGRVVARRGRRGNAGSPPASPTS